MDKDAPREIDPRETHIRALAGLMLPGRRLPEEIADYLAHGEYGLALEVLAEMVMIDAD
jgi:hypothetical protein